MIDYKLIRSKRKTLAIEVNRDLEVIVRAPLFVSVKRIEGFINERQEWIEKAKLKIAQKKEAMPPLSKEEIEALRKRAKQILPQKLEYYSRLMNLNPTALKITSAKTRFGSCSAKNSICFSLYLMRYPDECIDYVVVHELAHIKYKNHGKYFYALIEKYLPDYKNREKLLKNPFPNKEK